MGLTVLGRLQLLLELLNLLLFGLQELFMLLYLLLGIGSLLAALFGILLQLGLCIGGCAGVDDGWGSTTTQTMLSFTPVRLSGCF